MNNTLIYTQGGGRLGNQLVNAANLLSFHIETNIEVLHLPFIDFQSEYGSEDAHFCDIRASNLDRKWKGIINGTWNTKIVSSMPIEYIQNIFRVWILHNLADVLPNAQSIIGGDHHLPFDIPGEKYDKVELSNEKNIDKILNKKVSVFSGWGVRCWDLVKKHESALRDALRPNPEYISYVDELLKEFRLNLDKLVGIHIRQTDYKGWKDGKYYFDSQIYKRIIQHFDSQYPEVNIGYVICSDEPQPMFDTGRYFTEENNSKMNDVIFDFIKLSLCDCVLAPPSTFSTFAAFLGDGDLVPIHDGFMDNPIHYLTNPLIDSLDHPHMSQAIV